MVVFQDEVNRGQGKLCLLLGHNGDARLVRDQLTQWVFFY